MKRVGKEIYKALLSLDLFQGVARTLTHQIIHDELREKIFSPHRILKFMDLSSGSLNYAAIEILRSIENLVGHNMSMRRLMHSMQTRHSVGGSSLALSMIPKLSEYCSNPGMKKYLRQTTFPRTCLPIWSLAEAISYSDT
eukprot:scaffold172452_cov45-Attheya_sp.AAC.1